MTTLSSAEPHATIPDLRHVYLERALGQFPRLLSLQDRTPFSPTYGSLRRGYWLDKAIDFPDAQSQWGVHAMALAYANQMPDNPYYRHPKMLEWVIAALEHWARIQHRDGSFDEFYPYERGWAGPTAFTLHGSVEAFRLVQAEVPRETGGRIVRAIRRAAAYVAAGESEEDHLANHHAIAALAVWKASTFLSDAKLRAAYERLWRGFLGYHNDREGWSREYDGIDPGYLSATVSFLAKVYQDHPDPRMGEVLRASVDMASYFAYPNGHFAGSMGSRQTLHFYAHGFELLAAERPMAAALAQAMLEGLARGALVPPEIMPDRYMVGRTNEYLLAYLDSRPRPATLPALPYQQPPFRRWWPDARVYVARTGNSYFLANLAKGGVVKLFDLEQGRLLYNDCGILGRTTSGQIISSQWVDPAYTVSASDDELVVEGALNQMPASRTFTPVKMAAFRGVLASVGWVPQASHFIKGTIRKKLMLGTRPTPLRFRRVIRLTDHTLTVSDELRREGELAVDGLMFGDEFAVRYVPQSRYFQPQELETRGYTLTAAQIQRLNRDGTLRVTREIQIPSGRVEVRVSGDDVVAQW